MKTLLVVSATLFTLLCNYANAHASEPFGELEVYEDVLMRATFVPDHVVKSIRLERSRRGQVLVVELRSRRVRHLRAVREMLQVSLRESGVRARIRHSAGTFTLIFS